MAQFEEFHLGKNKTDQSEPIRIDAKGSQCPGPVLTLAQALPKATIDQQIIIDVTDPGFKKDAEAWSAVTGNPMISITENEGVITATFVKKTELGKAPLPEKEDSMTIIVFSNEMDKAMAAFNITLGALALGMKVQLFFTFWGLSLIRKDSAPKPDKESMAAMLPADDNSLPLSHDNLAGLGAKMMSRIMKEKNVPPLDFMIHLAKYDGVKFIACQMSMAIMGLTADQLMDGIEIGGVGTMIEFGRKSTMNYFI